MTSSYPFPDLSVNLTDINDDLHNQQSQATSSLPLSQPPVDPSMLQYATSSPAQNNASTPAESVRSIHYQSSNFSDVNGDEELFNEYINSGVTGLAGDNAEHLASFGTDFDLFAPSGPQWSATGADTHTYTTPEPVLNSNAHTHTLTHAKPSYPISPDQTPSLNAPASPDNQPGGASLGYKFAPRDISSVPGFEGLVSPEQLTKSAPDTSGITPFPDLQAFVVSDINAQLTPDTTSSGGSLGNNDNRSLSTDGGATTTTAPPMSNNMPNMPNMPNLNPHVTVSLWGKDSAYHEDSSYLSTSEIKTERADSTDGRRGIDPSNRSSTEFATTVNQDAEARKVEKQNIAVSNWLSKADVRTADPAPEMGFEGVSDREIALGDETENIEQPGRTYLTGRGGEVTETDYEIMLKSSAWDNSPSVLHIQKIDKGATRHQPETSQAAIERFERMYRDNASFVSRAATWGTRRRSLPSIAPSISDIEGVTSGNFLKKLTISRGGDSSHSRRPSIFNNLRDFVRKPSTSQNKRSRAAADDDASSNSGGTSFDEQRRDSTKSTNALGLPRTNSWGKSKQPMPSINTALISMGSNMASIGATHTRNGSVSRPHGNSISLSPPLTSPKSPLLKVGNNILRPRSKSDVRGIPDNAHPNLVRMLKKTGGPPVASLATANATSTFPATSRPFGPSHASSGSTSGPAPIQIPATNTAVIDPEDEDDDEDEAFDDSDMNVESNELIDNINPDFAGFKELVLGLNPLLATTNTYLVDRIAHQQLVRYKGLLNGKIKHLGQVKVTACPNRNKCIGQGGSAILCDSKGKPRSLDPLSTTYDADDVDDISSPLDGAINSDSFPQYIPMPPTTTLPAEFECQLCFTTKCPKKPSDWTKHVHEDVQPFTCTWDRCRDPKMFKRKADWVRHENEGHRHLEWWQCDVDDCRHTCYRRDNFLQHLVREHKFVEPKNKTKAAIKRAGTIDPTWQRVEQCRFETTTQPQEEPCRFCNKTFPTWKKLTVHLAKHMEHISLPILRLVERKEVDPDTLISPVQDPPPRTFAPVTTFQPTGEGLHAGLSYPSGAMGPQDVAYQQNVQNMGQMGQLGPAMGYGQAAAPENTYMYPAVTQVQYSQQAYYQQPVQEQPFSINAAATMNANVNVHQGFAGALPVTTGGGYGSGINQYITDMDTSYTTYPANTNALGLQTPIMGNQMHFDGPIDPSVGSAEYTPQGSVGHGSVSPFGHSPHVQQGQFYAQ